MNTIQLKQYYENLIAHQIDKENLLMEPDKDTLLHLCQLRNGGNYRALELGYGAGKYTIYLAQRGLKVTAIDIIDPNLLIDRIKNEPYSKEITVLEADIAKVNIDSLGCYDFIISRNVLHYLSKEIINKVILSLIKNTNPGGVHYFTVFTDITRYNKKRELISFEDEANYTADEFIKFINSIYIGWTISTNTVTYFEKDSSKSFNYFSANQVSIIAKAP